MSLFFHDTTPWGYADLKKNNKSSRDSKSTTFILKDAKNVISVSERLSTSGFANHFLTKKNPPPKEKKRKEKKTWLFQGYLVCE